MAKEKEFVLKGIVVKEQGWFYCHRIKLADHNVTNSSPTSFRFRLKDKTLFPFKKHDTVEIVIRRRRG